MYDFVNTDLFTSLNNSPQILNIKNDYAIWGERTGVSGQKIPILLRYAIDDKPVKYTEITITQTEIDEYNQEHGTKLTAQTNPITYIPYTSTKANILLKDKDGNTISEGDTIATVIECDWRELIYQMAEDYYKYGQLPNFTSKVAKANPDIFSTGMTGYENYYIDIYSLWRDIYNLPVSIIYQRYWKPRDNLKKKQDKTEEEVELIDLYKEKIEAEFKDKLGKYENKLIGFSGPTGYTKTPIGQYNFWFDMLDTSGTLNKYSVKAIGSRIKVVKDTKVESLQFRQTPSVLYTTDIFTNTDTAYTVLQVPRMEEMFSISNRGKSAEDVLKELIIEHCHGAETISINSVPIYYLQPNTCINISDKNTGIEGTYIINKLTIPLTYNGTMSISASKIVENII